MLLLIRIPGGTDILAVVKLISFVPEGQGEKLLGKYLCIRHWTPHHIHSKLIS